MSISSPVSPSVTPALLDHDRDTVVADDHTYVLHSWSAQRNLHPIAIKRAEGVRFWDYDGKEYLDFAAQLVNLNLGHQHPDLVRTLQQQAATLATIAPEFAVDVRSELAKRIIEHGPIPGGKVFFTNAGADANENAVRLARAYTGRSKVLSSYRSYHGATGVAIALTGEDRRLQNVLTDPAVVHFWGPYAYRSAFYATTEAEETARSLAHLEATIKAEGPESIAAIILETVVGTNGILVPPVGYLPGVRALCDKYGIQYIADEVMAGFGRTGYLFAVQGFDVQPDLLTFAKGVNSGYVPLGGVIMSPEIAATFDDRPYNGGLTYSGHPLGAALGVTTFDVIERDHILEHVRELEADALAPWLAEMEAKHPSVGTTRHQGMFAAVELVSDRETREMLDRVERGGSDNPMVQIKQFCIEHGLWPVVHGNRVHITPPLIISADDLKLGLGIIDEALTIADEAIA